MGFTCGKPDSRIEENKAILYEDLTLHGIYEAFTTCRAYMVSEQYDLSIIILTKILEIAKKLNRPLDIIEAGILLAISYWKKKRGFQEDAMRFLEMAVSVSYRFEYTQLFSSEGPEISGMMRQLKRSAEQRADGETAPVSFIKMLYLKTLENSGDGLENEQTERPVKYNINSIK